MSAGRSLKAGGFKTILFLGESGGNQTGMRNAADRLNELWKGEARAIWIGDYYTKSHNDQNAYVTKTLGIPANAIGGHANILDTSEMMFVNARHVRPKKMAPGGGYANSGVSGDPTKSTPELGKIFLQIKIDNAVAQIKTLTGTSGTSGTSGTTGTTGTSLDGCVPDVPDVPLVPDVPGLSSLHTGTPAIVSLPPKFVCTSTPTVQVPVSRDDVPIPPFQPKAIVPVPAPTAPSATGPERALEIASVTCALVM
jgi:hypothetical protein